MMRQILVVLMAIFLGVLITIIIKPLMGPLAPPPPPLPMPEVGQRTPTPPVAALPPTLPPATVPPLSVGPRSLVTPRPAPARVSTPTPTTARPSRATSTAAPRLVVRQTERPSTPASLAAGPTTLYIVQVALVPTRDAAARLGARLRSAGFDPYVVPVGEGFAVRLGAFRERARAVRLANLAVAKGFTVTILGRR